MKRPFIILCIACMLLCGCVRFAAEPDIQAPPIDVPSPPDNPTPPDNPAPPDDPAPPDNPAPPDVPNPPNIPEPPHEPELPVYPDITGFDTSDKTLVYSLAAVSLVSQSGESIDFGKGITFISVGNVDAYSVILRAEGLYLAPTELFTADRPVCAIEMQKQYGGTYYPGNEKTVVIDPGHQGKGMSDKEPVGPGSDILKAKVASGTQGISTGIEEYKLNLNVSLLLRDELIARGYTVVMIREDHDARISNAERAIMANNYAADAFIRVHANGSDNKSARGAIAIFQTKDNQWCGDLYDQSRKLSETVLEYYCQASGIENDGNWETDTMTGINWTRVPSTIIELGYMSNALEDELMATKEFHALAALGIANGVDAYFAK